MDKREMRSTAECLKCVWSIQAANNSATGNGSQHAKRTGHEVKVTLEWRV